MVLGATAATAGLVGLVGFGPAVSDAGSGERAPAGAQAGAKAVDQPLRVARPVHLDAIYVAPATTAAEMGRLRLARLGIDAPVVPVGWDADTMAVPNDVASLGWFEPTARLTDLAGASLIAGHVSDPAGRPGALAPLFQAQPGDIIGWRAGSGEDTQFRVTSVRRYPRATGLPPALFSVDGPHTLHLVTCANRLETATGFHYADNVVVSAVQV